MLQVSQKFKDDSDVNQLSMFQETNLKVIWHQWGN